MANYSLNLKKNFLKFLHIPLVIKLKKVIDIPLLNWLVEQREYTHMGQGPLSLKIFKGFYLFHFQSF